MMRRRWTADSYFLSMIYFTLLSINTHTTHTHTLTHTHTHTQIHILKNKDTHTLTQTLPPYSLSLSLPPSLPPSVPTYSLYVSVVGCYSLYNGQLNHPIRRTYVRDPLPITGDERVHSVLCAAA